MKKKSFSFYLLLSGFSHLILVLFFTFYSSSFFNKAQKTLLIENSIQVDQVGMPDLSPATLKNQLSDKTSPPKIKTPEKASPLDKKNNKKSDKKTIKKDTKANKKPKNPEKTSQLDKKKRNNKKNDKKMTKKDKKSEQKSEQKSQTKKPKQNTPEKKASQNKKSDQNKKEKSKTLKESKTDSQKEVGRTNTQKGNQLSEGTAQGNQLSSNQKDELSRYANQIIAQTKAYWNLPNYLMNEKRVTQVEIKISADGQLSYKQIVSPSGSELYDSLVLKAIEQAAPYPPAPHSIQKFIKTGIVLGFPNQ